MNSTLVHILSMLTVGTIGLLAGGLLLVSVSLIPLFVTLPPEQFVFTHKTLDRHMHPYMPSLSALALVMMLAELWLGLQLRQLVGTLIAIGCIVIVALISELINVPLNRKIAHWSPAIPDNQLQHWKRMWYLGHHLVLVAGAKVGLSRRLRPDFSGEER